MSKIILIDPLNKGYSHVYFNAVFTTCFSCVPRFIGNKTHVANVKELSDAKFIEVEENTVYIFRVLKVFFVLLRQAVWSKHKIYFLCIDNTIIPFLLILFSPLLRTNEISLIIHNNLTTLVESKVKRWMFKLAVCLNRINVFVLTKRMEEIYNERVCSQRPCRFFPHPNYRDLMKADNNSNNNLLSSSKVNIVVFGRQAQLLSDFLEELNFNDFPNLRFIIVNPNLESKKMESVSVINRRLSFKEYFSYLSRADFCLFANDVTVENRASGVFMDCITTNCPIIAPHFGQFIEYSRFNLGFLYSDSKELVRIFDYLSNSKIGKADFSSNFESAVEYSLLSNYYKVVKNE